MQNSQNKACLINRAENGRNWSEDVQSHRTLKAILSLMEQDYGLQVIEYYLRLLHGGVHYAAQKLRQPSSVFISNSSKTIYQGGKTHKKFLMLDLDETLIKT